MTISRRDFIATVALSSASLVRAAQGSAHTAAPAQGHGGHDHLKPERPLVPRVPAVLSRVTGTIGIDAAYAALQSGEDTLHAALKVTEAQENNPDDQTAGLGGLPNAAGEVQLDACCLHGPTRRGAAVGAVSGIRNASLLARNLMEHTAFPLLVGPDAQRFAVEQGFVREDLLTRRARAGWELWRKVEAAPRPLGPGFYNPAWPELARQNHFLPASQEELEELVRRFEPMAVAAGLGAQWTWRATYDALFPSASPLYVSAVNAGGELSVAATTSGLPWRMPGVTSDIAVAGAGCYLDPQVGSAGASGNASANIKLGGARVIVENMRRGMAPEVAGMDALHQLVQWYNSDTIALRFVEIRYYILRKDGAYGCVSLWHGDQTGHVQQFAIHDGLRRVEDCLFLFDGSPALGVRGSGAQSMKDIDERDVRQAS